MPKSRIFEDAVLVDHDVGRLDVAMHDACAVGVPQAGAQFLHQFELSSKGERRAAVDHVGQRLALDVLHRDKGLAVEFAHVEDGHDVDVMQAARRIGFTCEALAQFRAVEALAQELDRHVAVADLRIARQEEAPHPTGADALQDLVATDGAGSGLGHVCRSAVYRAMRRLTLSSAMASMAVRSIASAA